LLLYAVHFRFSPSVSDEHDIASVNLTLFTSIIVVIYSL